MGVYLANPTAYTPELVKQAHKLLQKIYKPGFKYKKAGVYLTAFVSDRFTQKSLFDKGFYDSKKKKLMKTIDQINQEWGRHTMTYAAMGIKQEWQMKQSKRSNRYTTKWDELVVAKS